MLDDDYGKYLSSEEQSELRYLIGELMRLRSYVYKTGYMRKRMDEVSYRLDSWREEINKRKEMEQSKKK